VIGPDYLRMSVGNTCKTRRWANLWINQEVENQ